MKDKHDLTIKIEHKYTGPDGQSSIYITQPIATITWQNGQNAQVSSSFGTNMIIHFDGDDADDEYILTYQEFAISARKLRDEIKGKVS